MPPQGGWGAMEWRLVPSVIGEPSAELMLNCNTHLEQRGAPAEEERKDHRIKGQKETALLLRAPASQMWKSP